MNHLLLLWFHRKQIPKNVVLLRFASICKWWFKKQFLGKLQILPLNNIGIKWLYKKKPLILIAKSQNIPRRIQLFAAPPICWAHLCKVFYAKIINFLHHYKCLPKKKLKGLHFCPYNNKAAYICGIEDSVVIRRIVDNKQ